MSQSTFASEDALLPGQTALAARNRVLETVKLLEQLLAHLRLFLMRRVNRFFKKFVNTWNIMRPRRFHWAGSADYAAHILHKDALHWLEDQPHWRARNRVVKAAVLHDRPRPLRLPGSKSSAYTVVQMTGAYTYNDTEAISAYSSSTPWYDKLLSMPAPTHISAFITWKLAKSGIEGPVQRNICNPEGVTFGHVVKAALHGFRNVEEDFWLNNGVEQQPRPGDLEEFFDGLQTSEKARGGVDGRSSTLVLWDVVPAVKERECKQVRRHRFHEQ